MKKRKEQNTNYVSFSFLLPRKSICPWYQSIKQTKQHQPFNIFSCLPAVTIAAFFSHCRRDKKISILSSLVNACI